MSTIKSLCVFCGSRKGADPAYEAAARRLGEIIAERGVHLVYGAGGIGLMGVLAETVLARGGKVTGIIPDFLMKYEVGDPGVSELIVVDSMHDRKRRMFEMSDGFVVLPGGLGTLDETFEITTWKQLRQHSKPIVIADVAGYWSGFKDLVGSVIDGGFAHEKINELFTVVETVEEVFPALDAALEPDDIVLTSHL